MLVQRSRLFRSQNPASVSWSPEFPAGSRWNSSWALGLSAWGLWAHAKIKSSQSLQPALPRLFSAPPSKARLTRCGISPVKPHIEAIKMYRKLKGVDLKKQGLRRDLRSAGPTRSNFAESFDRRSPRVKGKQIPGEIDLCQCRWTVAAWCLRRVRQLALPLDDLLRQKVRHARPIPRDRQIRQAQQLLLRLRSVSRMVCCTCGSEMARSPEIRA